MRSSDEEYQEPLLSEPQPESQPGATTTAEHGHICRRLYTSHALSTWNSRVFEFGAFLFLAKIYPHTLLPASVYALARAASAALFSPWLGSYIDHADRLKAVRLSILGQRLPVILSCAGLIGLLLYPSWAQSTIGKGIALFLLSALACLEKLSSVLNTISVERDWVVVVAGKDEARLATMNAQMRRIDLFCKLVGPLAISIVDSYSTAAAIFTTGTMSTGSVLIEYLAIARVHQAVPALQTPKSAHACATDEQDATMRTRLSNTSKTLLSYFGHPAFLPSFALALLYLTALSFSGQFITYLLSQNINGATVALFRAVAAFFEISATWLGPWLTTRIGPVRSGIWFLNAELLFIALSCAILWFPAANAAGGATTFALVLSVILSRTGLWGFDLSAQLIIQDEVEPSMRGTFSSLEASFQNIFEMLAFLSTIIFPRPEQFKYPAAMSAGAVGAAALLYACFVRGRRGHLLHMSRCLDRHDRAKHHDRSQQESISEEGPDNIVENDSETR
ncbi:hypothetical protein Q7P37_001325 [Cladosporium fusiforme]